MTNAGIGIVAMVATLAGALPCVLLIMVGGPVAVLGIGVLVLWGISVALVSATLTGILQVALYRFATGTQAPGFDTEQLQGTFRARNQRGLWN
jgi:membrane protein implicated in regulation of membrane protease activity